LPGLAKRLGIKQRQSYLRVGRKLLIKQGRYHHAKQFKRKKAAIKKLHKRLGRVLREIERKVVEHSPDLDEKAQTLLANCRRLYEQTRGSKNKLYSLHEPDTVCIAKGKAHKRYEFGNKSSFVTTAKECFILYAEAHEGNPYDGHTLSQMLEATNENLRELIGKYLKFLLTDKGYRGHGYEGDTVVLIENKTNRKKYKFLKRRSSIETVFSHTKLDHRMGRNFLKGMHGNWLNTIFAACGYNLKKIYNKFKEEFLEQLSLLLFVLLTAAKKEELRLQEALAASSRR